MRPLVRAVLRHSLRHVRYVDVIAPRHAQGLVAQVYRQTERDFGVLAPPIALHSPAPASLAATWLMLRETLLVDGHVSRTAKETLATEISRANDCPYCVDVHQAVLHTLPPDTTTPQITTWARTTGQHLKTPPGNTPPPFTHTQTPELRGVTLTFHYINRMVNLFLADSPIPTRTPTSLHHPIMRTTAQAMRPTTTTHLTPGESLDLLPPAPLPPELRWAQTNPPIAQALARAHTAINQAAHWIPEPIQQTLRTHLDQWNGTPPGPNRNWLDKALSTVPPQHHPATRLALLTAFAPYQTLQQDITTFKNHYPSDRQLIELTSYTALTTATHITNQTNTPHPQQTNPT